MVDYRLDREGFIQPFFLPHRNGFRKNRIFIGRDCNGQTVCLDFSWHRFREVCFLELIEKTFLIIGTFIESHGFGKYLIQKAKNRGSWNRQCTGRRKAGVHRKTVYIRRNVPHKEILLPACNYDVWFDSISDFISIVTDGTDGQGNQCIQLQLQAVMQVRSVSSYKALSANSSRIK